MYPLVRRARRQAYCKRADDRSSWEEYKRLMAVSVSDFARKGRIDGRAAKICHSRTAAAIRATALKQNDKPSPCVSKGVYEKRAQCKLVMQRYLTTEDTESSEKCHGAPLVRGRANGSPLQGLSGNVEFRALFLPLPPTPSPNHRRGGADSAGKYKLRRSFVTLNQIYRRNRAEIERENANTNQALQSESLSDFNCCFDFTESAEGTRARPASDARPHQRSVIAST